MTRTTHKQQLYASLLLKLENIGDAPCAENPDIFFPEDIHDQDTKRIAIDLAKVYCAECPIKVACAEFALVSKELHGIWGGLTPTDRGH